MLYGVSGLQCVWVWRDATRDPYRVAMTVTTPTAPRPDAGVRGGSDAVFGAMREDEGRGNILLSPGTQVVLREEL